MKTVLKKLGTLQCVCNPGPGRFSHFLTRRPESESCVLTINAKLT